MTKRNAIVSALAVPFVVEFALIAIDESARYRIDWIGMGGPLVLLFIAGTGLPFLALGFRPLHAALIGLVYLPLMMWALFGFGFVVVGLVYGRYL